MAEEQHQHQAIQGPGAAAAPDSPRYVVLEGKRVGAHFKEGDVVSPEQLGETREAGEAIARRLLTIPPPHGPVIRPALESEANLQRVTFVGTRAEDRHETVESRLNSAARRERQLRDECERLTRELEATRSAARPERGGFDAGPTPAMTELVAAKDRRIKELEAALTERQGTPPAGTHEAAGVDRLNAQINQLRSERDEAQAQLAHARANPQGAAGAENQRLRAELAKARQRVEELEGAARAVPPPAKTK
jgi:hypothetical protein